MTDDVHPRDPAEDARGPAADAANRAGFPKGTIGDLALQALTKQTALHSGMKAASAITVAAAEQDRLECVVGAAEPNRTRQA